MPGTEDAPRKADLTQLFEAGSVYADRWPPAVRDALDVEDPLRLVVVAALTAGKHVLLAGNAGDGKTHLAQRALDAMPNIRVHDVSADDGAKATAEDDVLYIRDASALSDEAIAEALAAADGLKKPLLICINEGPLNLLAREASHEFFTRARDVLHQRSRGFDEPDPTDTLIINLAGRQLARSESFIDGVLGHLLPHVRGCATCGRRPTCPRVVGAKLLRRSKKARQRLHHLVQTSAAGEHLTARDIWTLFIDLFFGWVCDTPRVNEPFDEQVQGYFWMRLFEAPFGIDPDVIAEFDPLHLAVAGFDSALWRGEWSTLELDREYPGTPPSVLSVNGRDQAALEAFKSAKRFFFFFSKTWDPLETISERAIPASFTKLLASASGSPRVAVTTLVGLINQYRLNTTTEQGLYLSRHHGFAAHRRPRALAASELREAQNLGVRVPFAVDAKLYPSSGFFPHSVILFWIAHPDAELNLNFATWQRLNERRTTTNDRSQEILDFALDIFIARGQSVSGVVADPELTIYDHDREERTVVRLRMAERRIELVT